MNLPNKLSMLRICLVPVMILFMSLNQDILWYLAAAVFMIASFTDYLDGHIARSQGLVTDLGRFLDPLADKLLVLSAMIALIPAGLMPAWLVVLVLARDLAMDGLRLASMRQGKVLAAGKLGKIKTASQMLYILVIMILRMSATANVFMILFTIWVAGITVYSLIDYFRRHGHVLLADSEGKA